LRRCLDHPAIQVSLTLHGLTEPTLGVSLDHGHADICSGFG
jgi:hypothetical protein